MKSLLLALCVLSVAGCSDLHRAGGSGWIPGTSTAVLDPESATFDAHIFALAPYEAAIPSDAYRARIKDGRRHRKTRAVAGEYVYVPESPFASLLPQAHDYALDRERGTFVTNLYDPEFPLTMRFVRRDGGWWFEDPSSLLFNAEHANATVPNKIR